jgi:fumarate reductase subunit D
MTLQILLLVTSQIRLQHGLHLLRISRPVSTGHVAHLNRRLA